MNPNQAQSMPLVGYASTLTALPGTEIQFMVSSMEPEFTAGIVRLLHGDENPEGPGFRSERVPSDVDGRYVGVRQHLSPGSYVRIPHDPALDSSSSFSVRFWMWPTAPQRGTQCLFSRGDLAANGLAIRLEEGRITAVSGGSRLESPAEIEAHAWHSVVVVIDGALRSAAIDVRRLNAADPMTSTVAGAFEAASLEGTDVLLAGEAMGDAVGHFYNGKLDGPALFAIPLSDDDRQAAAMGLDSDISKDLVASWDFSADIARWAVTDVSGHSLHGTTVNKPTRGVTGWNWDGTETAWRHRPDQYGAIHFHDDDLGDAGWTPAFQWVVPEGLPSGIYAAHVHTASSEDYIPFAVRPPRGTATAAAVFLMPTFSYLAYGNEQMLNSPAFPVKGDYPSQAQDQYILENRLVSLYDKHSDGSGVCHSSRLRPVVNMRPKVVMPFLNGGRGAPHQFNADLHVIDWLDHFGYDVDIVTDEDLHHEGLELLTRYRVLITGTHSEYWSGEMIAAAREYLECGGRMIHLAGNGMYWVTQLDPETGSSIEIRRRPPSTRTWETRPGEGFLSSTGELGGLWRYRGQAPQTWVGVGFTAETAGRGRPYRRQPGSYDERVKFVFEGVGEHELIGDFPSLVNEYGAAGFEFDREDKDLGSPSTTLVLATADGFDDQAQAASEEIMMSDSAQGGSVNSKVRADMVLLEYPRGGAVFAPGSITWGACLSYNRYDNNVSQITRNVLERFLSGRDIPARAGTPPDRTRP